MLGVVRRFPVNRTAKTLIYAAAALCIAVFVAALLFYRALLPEDHESVSETPMTSEFTDSMRAAGFPIAITRAVSASSHGGWHGDGQSLTAYRYPPHESVALIAALQQKHPEFSWSETRSEFVTRYSPWTLLPREMQPGSSSSVLFTGRPKEGAPTREYVVDRSRGTLYIVSNQF